MLPALTIGLVILMFAALFAVERIAPPLRRAQHGWRAGLLRRVAMNLIISAMAFATAALVVRPAAQAALGWSADTPFGLAHVLPLPAWAVAVVSFLLMDLSFYYWHLINHRIPLLWRFHNVHHTDPDLDVSTAFRFHFGEVALSAIFRVIQVVAIGVPAAVFLAYELAFQANTLFHHSNVRLPIRLERLLNRLLVTPRMHGIHHSQVHRENNSNFGVVFPWWDLIHRTLGLNVPQSRVAIGVPGYMRPEDNRLLFLLTMPFRRQRDYWRPPTPPTPPTILTTGEPVQRDETDLTENPRRLAE